MRSPFRIFSARGRIFLSGVFLALFAGCGTAQVDIYRFVDQGKNYPLTVAVLPFLINQEISPEKQPNVILREVFYNYFSYLGYTDVPLEEVDRKLAKAGYTHYDISSRPNAAQELKQILGVDAVIFGKVLDATNFTGGIHSQTTINAELTMIDLDSGKPLWATEHTERAYAGIATPAVVDIIRDQMDNAKVQEAYYHIAESFSIKVLNQVPDPSEMRQKDIHLPSIDSIETNIHSGHKLRSGDRIYVSLRGQPGLTACFDIGSWKTGIPMKEISPGFYTGSYRVVKTDKLDSALIIGTLKNKQGLARKKIYRSTVAIAEEAKLTAK